MKFKLLILALLICGSALIYFNGCTDDPDASPVGLDEATQKVLSDILHNDLNGLALYRDTVKMQTGTEIGYYSDPQPDEPYQVTTPSWFFFVDDNPGMRWAHACRYILIPYNGDNPRIIEEQWPPDNYDTLFRYYDIHTAIQAVISNVLLDDLSGKELAYVSNILPPGTKIADQSDIGILVEEYSWFFFIDDAPGTSFPHACRYVLVTLWGGEISIHEEMWPPDMALVLYGPTIDNINPVEKTF